MRQKLLDLMKNEGLKPSQLAEMLEINPAGISHILAGRNKPGFDLLQKILRRFPRINPDWLLLDSIKMYRDAEQLDQRQNNAAGMTARTIDSSIGSEGKGLSIDGNTVGGLFDLPGMDSAPAADRASGSANSDGSRRLEPASQVQASAPGKGVVEKVVICYQDGTFESYTPRHA